MIFDSPLFLILILFIPFLYILEKKWRKYHTINWGNFKVIKNIKRGNSNFLYKFVNISKYISLFFFIVAISRPQIEAVETLTGEGFDIIICLDMSGSMNAVDKSFEEIVQYHNRGQEPPNRFEIAREVIKNFIKSRREDRIGLVIFGEEAFLKFPLTLDYSRLLESIDNLILDNGLRDKETGECTNECTISGAATSIGDALALAYKRLSLSESKSKHIILITDGDDNNSKIPPLTMAQYISNQPEEKKVHIHTILVGSGENTKVPAINPLSGDIMRDLRGFIVYDVPNTPFPTDPNLLSKIAEMSNGKYFESYDEKKFREIFENLSKTEFKLKSYLRRNDIFFIFVFLGLSFFMIFVVGNYIVLRRLP